MSAQGATLGRGTVHIPIWPVAVVVLAATAAVIGLSSLDSIDTIAPARTLVTVTDAQRLANSTAAVREQAGSLPVVWGVSHVTPAAPSFTGFENPGAYITEAPSFATGLENPGAYGAAETAYASGFENPRAGYWDVTNTPKAARFQPIVVNGEICHQCR